jgi:hypothetical protein
MRILPSIPSKRSDVPEKSANPLRPDLLYLTTNVMMLLLEAFQSQLSILGSSVSTLFLGYGLS